jgi:hypothetical protein
MPEIISFTLIHWGVLLALVVGEDGVGIDNKGEHA